jgi:hypothetical protein
MGTSRNLLKGIPHFLEDIEMFPYARMSARTMLINALPRTTTGAR